MTATFSTTRSEEWIAVVRPQISKEKMSELSPEDLSPLLLDIGIDVSVVQLLADLKVNGNAVLQKGFVSATFTPQVLKDHNVNPQKLIEIRNSLLLSSSSEKVAVATPQIQMASLTTTIQGLPVFANDNLATALPILERLSQGNSYVSSVFKFVHSAAFAINNIWYDGAKQRCLDLLQNIQLTIQASPKFILSPPQRFNAVFSLLRNLIKEVVTLVATFVPPTDDVPFKQNAQYWLALFTAKNDEFVRLKEKLKDVNHIIVTQIIIALGQDKFGNDDDNQNQVAAPTEKLNVDRFTEDLLVSVRQWYDSHFKFELGSKGNASLTKLFIELKVLQTTNEDKKTKDQETLLNSGKIADTSSLHQYLWTGSSLSNIVLVEGPAGIGKTSFCMKLCCLQNIEGAVVIFVPLKQLLGCGRIDSISTLLSIINSPVSVIIALPNILHYNIPIVWVLDGFDEVMRTDDYSVQLFLNNFLDPITRKKNLDNNHLPNLVRSCDFVILTSRENRVDTNIVTIDGVKNPKLKPDLWIVQRWKRNNIEEYINNFFKTLNKPISETDVQLLVDHSLGPQMSGFHGIPLFIKLLCEAKLEDEKLDLTNISPPFLYHKTLRNAFVRAKIRIEYVLDTNPQFIRYKSDLNGLYDKILDDASKHAFQEFLAHRGTALTFSVSCDEGPPLWILVMMEMGVLLNDSNETKFKFQHRTFIEYLAAQFVALNPVEALPLVPLLDELDTTWLLICQLACLRENDGFFTKLLEKGLTTKFLANHVAERFLTGYHLVEKKERQTEKREEILALSEQHQIKLLVQIANSLPQNLFMDSLLDKHGSVVFFTPSQFKWMTEWCGYYGAIDVLKWFDDKTRFRSSVLSQQNCRYALCRALQRQSVSNVKTTIDFLIPRAGELSVVDAIATESVVALQTALQKKKKFEDDDLIQMFRAMIDRSDSNPNLIVAMCLFTEFTEDQLTKLDVVTSSHAVYSFSSPAYFFVSIALQVALPEFAEIWNFTTKKFDKINVIEEMKRRPIGRILSEPRDVSRDWDKKITEIFIKHCMPKFGKQLEKLKNAIQKLDLSWAREGCTNDLVTDETMEVICDCFPLLHSLNLTRCGELTDASLEHISKLSSITSLNLSWCNLITDVSLELISKLSSITSLNLRNCDKITDAGLEHISKLAGVTLLNLYNCRNITDVGLERVSKLTGITSLDLYGCDKITDVGIRNVAKLPNIASLDLCGCNLISDSSLERISSVSGITSLDLSKCNLISDAGLEHLSKLTGITSLNLFRCNLMTDAGLQHIAQLSNITTLVLRFCKKITDAGLEHLAKLSGITFLDLNGCDKVTDVGIRNVAKLSGITSLNLSWCENITDAGLGDISLLACMTSLNLAGLRKITDRGLEHITKLSGITSLDLAKCNKITNVGLEHIGKLSRITSLNLEGYENTVEAKKKLKIALPNCVISGD